MKQNIELDQIENVYFIGIGGIGMSALARFFHLHQINVSGYDKTKTELTKSLENQGISVVYEDKIELLPENIDLVIYTPAIPKDHLGLNEVIKKNIPLLKRAEVLGLISRAKKTVAIAGTHGKTTTSSMATYFIREGGIDATGFLGGIANNYNTNYIEGKSEWVVVEADEYDRSFLQLSPDITLLMSVDADHLDIYGNDEAVKQSYKDFVKKIKDGGTLIYHQSIQIAEKSEFPNLNLISFGIEEGDVYAYNIRVKDGKVLFDINGIFGNSLDWSITQPGLHNVQNALAAWIAAKILNIDNERLKNALATFTGIKRRFEYHYIGKNAIYIDDYAHHPTELNAAISAAKLMYPDKKITGIFQPHLFSRTRDFAEGFAAALDNLDQIILLDIYPAREIPIENITSSTIFDLIKNSNKILTTKELLLPILSNVFQDGVLLSMGAGDIDTKIIEISNMLKSRNL